MPTQPSREREYIRIECNETAVGVFWMLAVVLPLLGFITLWLTGVPFRFDVPAREFNPLVMIPVVATLAGIFFLLQAIFITLRLRRFGRSTLTLARQPRLGGRLQGQVTSTVDFTPDSEWRVVCKCIEQFREIGTDRRGHRVDITRWEYTETSPATYSLRTGIPLDIVIPENAADLTDPLEIARNRRGQLRWVLVLTGPRRGLDYRASFAIPLRVRQAERADRRTPAKANAG